MTERPDDPVPVGITCGICGGSVYMERCMDDGRGDHEWAVAGECQRCGERTIHTCPICGKRGDAPIVEVKS